MLLPGAALHYPISTTRKFLASCWPCLPAPPCVVVWGCLCVRRQSQAGKPPRYTACCRPGMRSTGWRASCLEGRALLVAQGNKNIYLFIVSQVAVKMDYRVQWGPGWLHLAASLPAFHEWVPRLGGLGLVGSMPQPLDVEGAGCPGGSAAPHSLSGASQTSQCFYIGIQFTLACVSKELEDCFS